MEIVEIIKEYPPKVLAYCFGIGFVMFGAFWAVTLAMMGKPSSEQDDGYKNWKKQYKRLR